MDAGRNGTERNLAAIDALRQLGLLDDGPVGRDGDRWEVGAIYARVSSETQDSLEAQTEACLRRAEIARISVPAGWRFAEKASGLVVSRTEYQKVMDLARRGQIKHIIVFLPDRLGRDAGAFISDMRALERLGVRVHTHIGEIPWEMVPFLGIMNEYYSRNLSEHVANRQEELVNKGRLLTLPSFGYRAVSKGVWTIDKGEAPLIRALFERMAAGQTILSLGRWIAQQTGAHWSGAKIRYALENPVYMGLYRYRARTVGKFRQGKGDKTMYVEHPELRIVEPPVWFAAWKAHRDINGHPGYERREGPASALTGLLYCARCTRIVDRGRLKGEAVPRRLAMSHFRAVHTKGVHILCCECHQGVRMSHLWLPIQDRVFAIPCGSMVAGALRRSRARAGHPAQRLHHMHREVEALRDQKADLLRQSIDPASRVAQLFTDADVRLALAKIDHECEAINEQMREVEAEAEGLRHLDQSCARLTDMESWGAFPELSVGEQNEVLKHCIDSIYVDFGRRACTIRWKPGVAKLVGAGTAEFDLPPRGSRAHLRGILRRTYLPIEDAKIKVRELGLTGFEEYRAYLKEHRPDGLPCNPTRAWGEAWTGYKDFFGTTRLPFVAFRAYARGLHLKTVLQYRAWALGDARPAHIPTKPDYAYRDEGWTNWPDVLGVALSRPYAEAKALARSMAFSSREEYCRWALSADCPQDMPLRPERVYQGQGWEGYAAFLGRDAVAGRTPRRAPRPYPQAEAFVHEFRFTDVSQYRVWAYSEDRPLDIPATPDKVYKDKGWRGWKAFLQPAAMEMDSGETEGVRAAAEVARACDVDPSFFECDGAPSRDTGRMATWRGPGKAPLIMADQYDALRAQWATNRGASLDTHCHLWAAATGQRVSISTMRRMRRIVHGSSKNNV